MSRIERRANARIERSALDEVRAIRTLLHDSYKDAGDGRTLIREIVQNADDAEASRLVFMVRGHGLPGATNSLLRGPALIVGNDGPFREPDWRGIHQALGGSKAEELSKVGRFGVGLKSAFHVCEAIVYLGAEDDTLRLGVLNPWAGTGDSGDVDPIHPDWDSVADPEADELLSAATSLLRSFHNGLLLWIPLRLPVHLDRAQNRQYGLGDVCPSPETIRGWFRSSAGLAVLLAQCGHLRSIECISECPDGGEAELLARVDRPNFTPKTWVGRPTDDRRSGTRPFEGAVSCRERTWEVQGIDAVGSQQLRALRQRPDWSHDQVWVRGKLRTIPRKALGHAAVTILHTASRNPKRSKMHVRWAVFLPLDDDPEPRPGPLVEPSDLPPGPYDWEILLHGYFWPSHDRRSIPGVAPIDIVTGAGDVRAEWNRAVRDDLLLPLLPSILADASGHVDESSAVALLTAFMKLDVVEGHLDAIASRDALLPVLTVEGIRFEARPRECQNLSVPEWERASDIVRARLIAAFAESDPEMTLTREGSPRIGGAPVTWRLEWVNILLHCVTAEVLDSAHAVRWVESLVRHVIGRRPDLADEQPAAVADWLGGCMGDGVLASTTGQDDGREELRDAWRRLFRTLPQEWLLEAPLESQPAVVELARGGLIGRGLLPVPLGRSAADGGSHLDQQRIDRALLELGRKLADSGDASQGRQRSRLLLAERLLAVRDGRPLADELASLPLLRAHRLPEGHDEPWSMERLWDATDAHRVFSKPGSELGPNGDTPADFRKTVHDLASALGQDVWLVEHDVARLSGAPRPQAEDLAAAVLAADEIGSAPPARLAILRRLSVSLAAQDVKAALRVLLGGSIHATREEGLYFIRSRDSERDANQRSLTILLELLGRPWRAVDERLAEALPQALCDDLDVRAVDSGQFQQLISECLEEQVNWLRLKDTEILHILQRLHGTGPEARETWCAMPLHRRVDGGRGPVDHRTVLPLGSAEVPPELVGEIIPLDPDLEVISLYDDVPKLDEEGILRLMLASPSPHQFADRILRAVYDEERVILPRDAETRRLIGQAAWFPLSNGSGVSPERLLFVPTELHGLLTALAAGGVLGDFTLSNEVEPNLWRTAEPVIHEILRRPAAAAQVRRIADAVQTNRVSEFEEGAYLVLPHPDHASAELINDVIQTPVAGSLPGWSLLHATVKTLGGAVELSDLAPSSRDAVVALARSLSAPLPPAQQVAMLKAIAAARPARESPGGRAFRAMLDCFAADQTAFADVLPHLVLPTQDGQWHPAVEIAKSTSGLARRHLLRTDLREPLGIDHDGRLLSRPTKTDVLDVVIAPDRAIAKALRKFFAGWKGRVPEGAVGAFLSLLGDGREGEVPRLAAEWIGEDLTVEGVRQSLIRVTEKNRFKNLKIGIAIIDPGAKRLTAMNLLGHHVEMDVGTDHTTIFATDPLLDSSVHGSYWELQLLEVDPKNRTAHQLIDLLGGAAEWWAVKVLGLGPAVVQDWWARWGRGSQAQVGPVRASVLAHLPLTLAQLDVHENDELQHAVREAQRAQRQREQAPPKEQPAALDLERKALDNLAHLVAEDGPREFLWQRVQEQIRRFGYRVDSVLLELAQNADDALAQAGEISGRPLPVPARRLFVRVQSGTGAPWIDVLHYGRPINETGGSLFPAGRSRQWDQDLYFMMLLNLSAKPGETPGRSSSSSTTGRFGLGFKSVHLVSAAPEVVSGFLAFTIAAGVLPEERPLPDDPDLAPAGEHRATRIRLPVRQDTDPDRLIEDLFARFAYARVLMPVFARQIREVIVEGGPQPGVSAFDYGAVENASGWVVARQPVELSSHGQWRILRFRLAEAAHRSGTAAVAFGLRDGSPSPLPRDVPFIWNVTPTSESWGCGYAINGPFKLDPGRTHVSLDDPATLTLVDSLGENLGKGLIALHDSLLDETKPDRALAFVSDATRFVTGLWEVLTTGLTEGDSLRQGLLHRLHGPGRGLTAWMQARSVVPTGLPRPYPQQLPPLGHVEQIEIAAGGLDDPDLCSAIATVERLASFIRDRCVVTPRVAERLRPFVRAAMPQVRPADLFAALGRRWGQRLTPERLHQLRAFGPVSVWELISASVDDPPWHAQLRALSQAGGDVPLRQLLIPSEAACARDPDMEEELRRAALAPDSFVLAPDYIQGAEDLIVFRHLRGPYAIGADTLASWFADMPADRWRAALQYLLHGKLHSEVLERIVPEESRPDWLTDYDGVLEMLNALTDDPWRREGLLGALFPERYEDTTEEESILPESVKQGFFSRLQEWWDDQGIRHGVIAAYEARVWPDWLRRQGLAEGLKGGSKDHWLGLLVLGACQSLGLTQPDQHRQFIENARREGWWDVFMEPEGADAWMGVLRTWQDRSTGDLHYARWMSLFPAIYQLSRFVEVYRRLLLSAGRRPEELYRVSSLLAPRVDQALTGAGQRFDAPPAPLDMGKHWVLRELVRLDVMPRQGDHVLPDCWVPSEQVITLLRPLGLTPPDSGALNTQKARAVFDFLATALRTPSPHLHYAFDVPLRHVSENRNIRRELGLEV